MLNNLNSERIMNAKIDSEIQNTLDYLLSGDVSRKQAAKRLSQLCEDYHELQIKTVNGVDKGNSTCNLQIVSERFCKSTVIDNIVKTYGITESMQTCLIAELAAEIRKL